MPGVEQPAVKLHCIVASRNIPDKWAEECLDSILSQKLPSGAQLRVTWTDDASPGGPPLSLQACPDDRLTLIENKIRLGGLYNHVQPCITSEPEEICLPIGGDDWLEAGALERIADLYSSAPDTWLTYGTIRNTDNSPPPSGEMKHWEVRRHGFVWMPTTVRAGLVHRIDQRDLQLDEYVWMPSAGDTALILPLLEMSGPEHTAYISTPWYVRRIHESNDHVVSGRLQSYCGWEARCKPMYSRLRDLNDIPTRTNHTLNCAAIFVSAAPQAALMAVREFKKEDGTEAWQLLPGSWDQDVREFEKQGVNGAADATHPEIPVVQR